MRSLQLLGRPVSLSAAVGLIIVAVNLCVFFFVQWIAPHDPSAVVGAGWAPPSWRYPLGLDNLGRDLFSRILYGARVTIGAAFAATLIAYLIGGTLGIVAALAGRWIDLVISRVVDVFLAIPTLIFALVLLTVFQGTVALIVTIGILMSPRVYRLTRAVAMDIVALDYVEAARMRGERYAWLIVHEILPNALPALVAEFGVRICFALMFVSGLSFLGFGVQPPNADWGSMVRENAMMVSFGGAAPLYPAAAIALLIVGVNLVVDWYLAARLRKGEELR